MKRHDIIISGGGMIGALAAVAAISSGFSVLLIEANSIKTVDPESPRDLRVSAISWANIDYLKTLDVFSNIIQNRIQSYDKMQVWDNRSAAKIDFTADYSVQKCLGYLIENTNLVQAAWRKLQTSDRCQLLEKSRINRIENQDNQMRIELENGDLYKGRLLIAAEGRKSNVREFAGIKTTENKYHQSGLVAYITLENAPSETALQAFNHGGPIGILPVAKGLFSIVWSVPTEQSEQWLNCSKPEFELGVKKAIGREYGSVQLISKRAVFPLTQLYAHRYFDERVVLCGDSAHGVHPLAGQGVNLGIGDIQLLFKLLTRDALRDSELLNVCLRKYQRRRISQVKETSEMMNFLHHLFKDDQHIKKPVRTLAFNAMDRSPFKKWFVNQAGS